MEQITDRDYTLAFVDACPSELLHNSDADFLGLGLVTFFRVDRKSLKSLSQFKNIRGVKRRSQTQDYLIERIKEEKIVPFGVMSWNYKSNALKNGAFILHDSGISNSESEKIIIANHEINFGLGLSLAWYSIIISIFLKSIGQIANAQNMKKVAIFLDLLPGDNDQSQRNFEIVEYIISNSRLAEFQNDTLEKYKLEKIGYGYGMYDQSTRDFKNDYEFVITDWIVQSFYSLLKYEQEKLTKESDEYQLSKLARFLVDENRMTIRNAFNLVNES